MSTSNESTQWRSAKCAWPTSGLGMPRAAEQFLKIGDRQCILTCFPRSSKLSWCLYERFISWIFWHGIVLLINIVLILIDWLMLYYIYTLYKMTHGRFAKRALLLSCKLPKYYFKFHSQLMNNINARLLDCFINYEDCVILW